MWQVPWTVHHASDGFILPKEHISRVNSRFHHTFIPVLCYSAFSLWFTSFPSGNMAFWDSIFPYSLSRSTSTPSASTTLPFSNSVSADIPALPPPPPWQWWTRSGTSPLGKTWAQRQADSTFLISMNERMIRKHIEEQGLRGCWRAVSSSEDVNLDFDNSSSFLFPRSCDVRIICGDTIFSAHKIVLCRLSPFFKANLHGRFRVSIVVGASLIYRLSLTKMCFFRNAAEP